jgi:hypothetical protein
MSMTNKVVGSSKLSENLGAETVESQPMFNHFNIKKQGVFWDVTPCGSCKNQRFGGT